MQIKRDSRLPVYRYWLQLMKHINNDTSVFFNGKFVYPRQFEIHLPSNHQVPCNLHCPHCAGKFMQKDLGTWEMDALELLGKLEGKIPYHIFGGNYTEPLLNPHLMTFLHITKRHGNHFGIHTNGTMLSRLEEQFGWLTELNRISTDSTDYLSVSLDAGLPASWAKTKGCKQEGLFNEIIQGLQQAVEIRRKTGKGHAIRLCYLISPDSDSPDNFSAIVQKAREIGVDSLRFSIPFAPYNQSFDKVREYKQEREVPFTGVYEQRLMPYLSTSETEKPYIFYTSPDFTDIDKYDFNQCVYSYYQITYGADGYAYRCSTTASPTMAVCRLGKITGNLDKFHQLLVKNTNPDWEANTCFARGARCNRMGLEINRIYSKRVEMQAEGEDNMAESYSKLSSFEHNTR